MTTIAYRNGELAADSQVSFGGDITFTFPATTQKLIKYDNCAIAMTGDLAICSVIAEYIGSTGIISTDALNSDGFFTNHIRNIGEKSSASRLLILTKEQIIELDTVAFIAQIILDEYYAIGTGHMFAFGALAHGADAVGAVRIASQFEHFTNDKITLVRREDL